MVTKGQLNNALDNHRAKLRKERTEDLLISNINQNDCIKTITGDIGDIINDFHFKDREDKEIQAKLEKSWKWQFKQLLKPKKLLLLLAYATAIITASYFAEDIENIKILFDIINVFN